MDALLKERALNDAMLQLHEESNGIYRSAATPQSQTFAASSPGQHIQPQQSAGQRELEEFCKICLLALGLVPDAATIVEICARMRESWVNSLAKLRIASDATWAEWELPGVLRDVMKRKLLVPPSIAQASPASTASSAAQFLSSPYARSPSADFGAASAAPTSLAAGFPEAPKSALSPASNPSLAPHAPHASGEVAHQAAPKGKEKGKEKVVMVRTSQSVPPGAGEQEIMLRAGGFVVSPSRTPNMASHAASPMRDKGNGRNGDESNGVNNISRSSPLDPPSSKVYPVLAPTHPGSHFISDRTLRANERARIMYSPSHPPHGPHGRSASSRVVVTNFALPSPSSPSSPRSMADVLAGSPPRYVASVPHGAPRLATTRTASQAASRRALEYMQRREQELSRLGQVDQLERAKYIVQTFREQQDEQNNILGLKKPSIPHRKPSPGAFVTSPSVPSPWTLRQHKSPAAEGEWQEHFDARSGRRYWFNVSANKTTYYNPYDPTVQKRKKHYFSPAADSPGPPPSPDSSDSSSSGEQEKKERGQNKEQAGVGQAQVFATCTHPASSIRSPKNKCSTRQEIARREEVKEAKKSTVVKRVDVHGHVHITLPPKKRRFVASNS